MTKAVKEPKKPKYVLPPVSEWGAEKYGINVRIDSEVGSSGLGGSLVIDVEDNEAGAFVGLGIYDGGLSVFYYSRLTPALIKTLEASALVAHNGKSDLHKLRSWGVNVKNSQLVFDTMIASYVINSTKESHGLKDLAKTELGIEYPSYREITGSGRNKTTLDKHPTDLVANYNAMDCLATYKLWKLYDKSFTPEQRRYFDELEMPITRLLLDMEEEGVQVDIDYIRSLDSRLSIEADLLLRRLRSLCGEDFNPSSPKQVGERLLQRLGLQTVDTSKQTLQRFDGIPVIQMLLRYREVTKLRSTYTAPYLELNNAEK